MKKTVQDRVGRVHAEPPGAGGLAGEGRAVEIPAYTALQADQGLADRMLELVLQGVSTRKYETVLPAMADQVEQRSRVRNRVQKVLFGGVHTRA